MSNTVLPLVATLFLALPPAAAGQTALPPSCATPEFRQFDFWLGDWTVHLPDGRLAGTNLITREFKGCVLHEHWAGHGGSNGESFNIYDAARESWHQTWVDDGGTLLTLEGGLVGTSMVLSGEKTGAGGARTIERITWTPDSDGRVRQLWESSPDGGKTWTVQFDGLYTRKR